MTMFRVALGKTRLALTFALGVGLLLVVGCSSGGGGGGAPLSEYERSNGLGQIRAAEGYAKIRAPGKEGGEGTRLAIIDSGVDGSHVDLEVAETYRFSNFTGDSGHGSHVAGIAAARRNGRGTHGVAYNADIIDIGAATQPRPINYAYHTVAASIASAAGGSETYCDPFECSDESFPDARSDVMNLSLGGSLGDENLLSALRLAAAAEVAIVAAAGNSGRGRPDVIAPPDYPAAYASETGVAGMMIAVAGGFRTSSGWSVSLFSSGCLGVESHCIVAPGLNILSTEPGDEYGTRTGTSMSAAHVSGAIAVVSAAFPDLTMAQIVQRILDTADPIPGCPPGRCGVGALNLSAALSPVGTTSATVQGGATAVVDAGDRFAAGAAFGDAADRLAAALGTVLVVDSQGFPFHMSLDRNVSRPEIRSLLSAALSHSSSESAGIDNGAYGAGHISRSFAAGIAETDGLAPSESSLSGQYSAALTDGLMLNLSVNSGLPGRLADPSGSLAARFGLSTTFGELIDHQNGVSLQLGDDTESLSIGVAHNADLGQPIRIVNPGTVIALEAAAELAPGLRASIGGGWVLEEAGALGSDGEGALGSFSASTRFIDGAAHYRLTDRLTLSGLATLGLTRIDERTVGLIGADGDLLGVGYRLGLDGGSLLTEGDGLRLEVGQPLRIESGSLVVIAPRSAGLGATVERTSVDASPDGREIYVIASYRRPLLPGAVGEVFSFARDDPGHVEGEQMDVGGGIRLQLKF